MQPVYVSTILNVLTDILVRFIPLPPLWKMNVSLGKKIGLILMLCSGFFVVTAALVRFGFTIVEATSVNLNRYVLLAVRCADDRGLYVRYVRHLMTIIAVEPAATGPARSL